jgi:ribosomal protein S18 acetylase RimI-like enzyme
MAGQKGTGLLRFALPVSRLTRQVPLPEIVRLPVGEWPAYKSLRLSALKTEPQAFGSSLKDVERSTDEEWRRRLQDVVDGKSHLVLARLSGRLVGMVGAFQREEDKNSMTANIFGMYVEPESRSLRVGRLLLVRLLENLAESGMVRTILDVNTDQLAAKQLYVTMGFAVTGSHTETMGDGKQHMGLAMQLLIPRGNR